MLAAPAGRPNAACPRCELMERHRLLWLYMERETDLFTRPQRVLHIAPEPIFAQRLRAVHGQGYLSGDLFSPLAMERIDITDIHRPDASFDVVLCCHVLEHVPDDVQAMSELRRVLRPEGMALMQHPIDRSRQHTYEDWSITDPRAREAAFLQSDHVRIYGLDFEERLQQAGFSAEVLSYRERLSPAELDRYCLNGQTPGRDPRIDAITRGEDIYVCRTR
jgi:SAM-dependent methyltransferase